MTRKVFAWLLTAAMAVTMLGCGTQKNSVSTGNASVDGTTEKEAVLETVSEAAPEAEDSGLYSKVRVAMSADWKSMMPVDVNTDGKQNFMWNIYEALYDIDDMGSRVGSMAKTCTEVDDVTWDIEIYDCIYDSEGNNITASDVVYSVYWLYDSGEGLGYDYFESVEVKDDYTVTFHWTEKPASGKDLEWPLCRTMIFSQKAFEDGNFATNPVGTGNYKVTEFTTGSKMVLEARDDYWGADQAIAQERLPLHTATVQTIEYDIITEASQAAVALEMGTVDFCDYVSSDMLFEFEEGGQYGDKYNVIERMSNDYYIILPNCAEEGAVGDENLRLAMFYALDNETIAKAMGGDYKPLKAYGTSYFADYNSDWENNPTTINTYDPELAKEYLEKSNYKGQTLQMIGLSSEAVKNAMVMIQAQLLQAGINTEIGAFDQSTLDSKLGNRTGWDFCVSFSGGSSLVGSFGGFNNKIHDGYNKGWAADEVLQEKYETAKADATHDDEHMWELLEYILGKGYGYAFAGSSSSVVAIEDLQELYTREGHITIGASTFAGK